MPLRDLAPDEEVLPTAPAAAAPRPKLRILGADEEIFPAGVRPPLKPYTPSIGDVLLGRSSESNENVEGILPALGGAAAETAKDTGAGIMRGGAAVGDLAQTGMRKLTNWYSQASPEDVARGEREQEEGRQGAQDFFTPKDQTPAGKVLGGLGEMVLPLAATGGNPALLVASEYERRKKELVAEGVDEETADRIAAIHGMATAAGAKLPILGKTLTSRLLTGASGNVVLNTAEQQQEKQELEDANYPKQADQIPKWWDPEARITDLLMGAGFGAVHHMASGAEPSAGSRPGAEGPPTVEGEIVPPGPRPRPAAGEGVTVEGQTIKPAYPELPPPPPKQIPGEVPPHEFSPVEQETELKNMGLTPDIIGNIIKLEDEAERARAARVLPPPDKTIQVSPGGEARPAVDAEAQARTEQQARDLIARQQEAKAKAATQRETDLGLTPDVKANLERLQSRPAPIGDELKQSAGPTALSVTPEKPATADQGLNASATPETTVQTPKKLRPLRADEEVLPIEHVTPGEKGIGRKRGNKEVRKYLSTKRPAPTNHDELVMYRTEATLGHNMAVEKGAPANVIAFLRAESEWAHGELANRSPDTLESLGVDAKGMPTGRPPTKAPKKAKPQSVLEHMAENGGLSIDALEKEGIDRADMRSVKGFKRPFTKKGMSLDAAAEKLHEAGYPVADEAGRPDANKALALIDAEIRGKKTYARSAELGSETGQAPTEKRTGVEARAGEERRAPPPRGTPERRGVVGERRKPVAEMSHEEMRQELLTSHLTGLPNRRAYDEAPRQPHQGSIDVDSLKWVNDNMGHGSGDELLKAVGQALKEAAGDRAFHFSGDEFAIEGKDADELHAIMEHVNERLAQATIEVTKADGSVVTLDGLGVSYGLGETLDAADENLSVAKQTREAQGVRAPRGEKPVGATVRGGGDEGGSDHQGNAPAGVKEPDAGYEPGAEPRAAEPGDVEHVTLTGEGHVSHTTRGEGEHVTVGEELPPEHQIETDSNDLAAALKAAHNNGSDENYSRVRRLMMRFEMTHGTEALSDLIDRLDKELDIEAPELKQLEPPSYPGKAKPPKAAKPAQGDLFTKADARPDASEKQIARANQLLKELEDATESDEEGDIKSVAVSFNKEFRADHAATLVGKTVKSTNDLARLSEIYRDPRYETLRYFMVNREGRIIAQTGVSSRLPGAGAAFPQGETLEWIRKFVDKYPGSRLWMQHNHPSGLAVPSTTDVALTQNVAKTFGIHVNHIVIDHDHYGRMIATPDGTIASNEKIAIPEKMGHDDPLHTPSKPHALLGRQIVGPSSFVALAKGIERKGGYLTVVGTGGAHAKVKSIGDMPAHLMNNPERLKQQLRRYGVQNGAGRLFIVGVDPELFRSEEGRKFLNDLQYDNYITDAVDTEGYALSNIGGGVITQSGRDFGVNPHEVSREIPIRKAGEEKPAPAKREEKQADLLGDDVEGKNAVARAESAKSAKRSPNKEVPADTGRPGDLFTRHKQLDLVKDIVPYERMLQKRADGLVEKITQAITEGGADGEKNTVGPLVKQLQKVHRELADEHYGERLRRNNEFLEAAERGGDKERAEKIYDKLYGLAEKFLEAGGDDRALIRHAPALADDFPPRPREKADDLVDTLRTVHNAMKGDDTVGEPTPEETDAYIAKHKTGSIASDAYARMTKDLSWLGDKEKYGELVKTVELKGEKYEFRKTGEVNRYTKHDENDEIVRGPDGHAQMMTPEEIDAEGLTKHDQTIAVFHGDKAVAFAANEFGTTGIFVQHDYQRRGLGKELLTTFRKENPKLKLGQMTPQGEELVRKAHAEGLIEESRSRYGGERRTDQRRGKERGGRRENDEAPSQKGDKGYAAVAQKAIDAFNKRIGWRYGPLGRLPEQKSYLEQRYKALGSVKAGQEIARQTYDALHAATPADAKAVYEYLTNKNGNVRGINDPDVRAAAKKAKDLIDKIGQRLVDTGLLSQEAYDEHAGEYLPRLYLKHVLGEGVMSAIGSGKRMSDLGYLKRRQDIPEEVRKVILGEITDPAFLASFGISRTLRDLALVDFLHAIAGRELWTPKHSTVEWRGRQVTPFYLADEARALRKRAQLYTDPAAKAKAIAMADEAQRVADEGLAKLEARPDPNDFEQIPNSRRYGALRGLYVRKEIYGDLVGAQQWVPPNSSVAEALLGQGGLAAKAQSWWKLSKVILNPPTQVRNFVANMMLLHLSGVPFHRVYSGEIIGKAINSLASKDRFYDIAKKYGLFAATFANNEGARIRDEWLALQDMKGGGLAKMKAFAARGVNVASDFYQLMEAIGKIAKIRDAMEREGKSPADAVLEAHEALFDYSLVPRSVQYLRNAPIGAPFITFAYKAAAQMAKIAVKHPARFAPYIAIPFLMSALIKSAYDVTDDDLKKLKNAFPAWMKQRGHMLLLPYKDAQGRWQNVDMGYLTPWGQFADMYAQAKEGEGAGKLAGSMVFSGPMMDVASALQTNVDPFTGKPIVDDRDPPADKLQSMMQYVWNLAAPGWLTEQGALNQLRKAMSGTNINQKTGQPGMNATQASLRLIGLNVYPADPELSRAQNIRAMERNLDESKARAKELIRDRNLTDKERDDIRETWRKLLEARAKEIELYQRGSEINPKLK